MIYAACMVWYGIVCYGMLLVIRSITSPTFQRFQSCLTSFAINLAQLLVRDGEGATKFVTIEIRNGRTYQECKQIASSIATSALVKTAMYGQDANWSVT